MTWLARLSLTNRAIVGLVTVLVLVFGAISATSLRQELLPSLDVPVLTVVTAYPGASPDVVEQQVTDPIEAAVAGLDGLTGTESTTRGGSSVITIDLDYGTDTTEAATQVERAIAGTRLPEDVEPQVGSIGTDSIPVLQLAVSSNLGADRLAAVLRDDVQPLLAGLDGVGEVTLSGIRDPQVTIDLDAAAAAQRGVPITAVSSLLQANGVRVPAGELTPDTAPTSVQVGSPITSAAQIADLFVTGQRGPVRLGDIATVTAEPAPATGYTRTNGADSIGVGVTKLGDANTVVVSDEVREALPEVTDLLGGDVQDAEVTVVFDQAPFIEQSVEDLTTEGLLGLAFAVLVILGFLLSVRATLVTAVSIPLSVLLALIALQVGGYTLNILTLGALTVAVGRVVDDSIVVIENIKRHIGYGGPRSAAILTAIREVAGAITASTVTTVAVFAPIGFVGGQVGELFRPFAVTVTAALLASLVVSLTVVPVLASLFLRSPAAHAVTPGAEPSAVEAPTALQRSYLPVLRGALARPVVALLVALGILAGTAALVPLLQTNFLGDAGGDTLTVRQELEPGTGLPDADAAARRVEDVLADTEGVDSYQVTVGNPAGGAARLGPPGSAAGSATRFSVTLADDADGTAVADDLRERLADVSDAGVLTVAAGQGGFGSDQLAVDVRADDPEVLADAAGQVERAVADIPGAADVRNNLAAEQATIDVTVDRRLAAEQGLSEAQVGQAVATALRGSTVGSLTLDGAESDVVLRTGDAPADLAALEALPVGTGTLGEIATVTQTTTAPSVVRVDGERTAQITARPEADDLGAVTADLQTELDDLDLPEGATAEIGGVSAEQGEAFAQLGLALLAAIAVVYLVMVVTFRSLLQPLLLLVAIPFAATGALGLLLVTGTPLGVPALIGMLMLVGIVVTNAIVLIDLVNQYRRDGRPLMEALVEGAAQRLRPILMTAVATVFALLPMAFGLTGGGAFISQPLAVVVIGGLVTSTLLTLVLVPVLYLLAERGRERRRGGPPVPVDGDPDGDGRTAGPADDDALAAAAVPEPARSSSAVPAGYMPLVEPYPAAPLFTKEPAPQYAAPQQHSEPQYAAPQYAGGQYAGGPAVTGTVTDHDGRPLAGAGVVVFDEAGARLADAVSAAGGAYSADLPGPGEYLVVAQAGEREPGAAWVRAGDGPVRRDLAVEGPASVAGTVRATTGAGVAALVTVVDRGGDRLAGTRAGTDGRYLLPHVPEGEHRLLVAPQAGTPTTVRVTVPATGLVRADVDLRSTGGVSGVVRTAAGRAVGDAVATVVDAGGRVVATGRTGPDGSFRLAGLPDGSYTVTATTTRPAVGTVVVRDGATSVADLALDAPGHDGEGNGHHPV